MPHKRLLSVLVLAVLLLSIVILVTLICYAGDNAESKARKILSQMTLEEKVGQLFLTSFKGQNSIDAKYRLGKFHNGGFIIYEANVRSRSQLKNLISILKGSSSRLGIPLFVAIDHEGGHINRLAKIIGKETSARDLVLGGSSEKAYEKGKKDAIALKSLGINLNFAPVLDVRTNPRDTMLGDRSFGDDPRLVSEFGLKYLRGLSSEGLVGVAKHFPGHGSVDVDSHYALPMVELSKDELNSVDLKPFRDAIDDGAKALMIGHLLVKSIDETLPSSISPKIINGLLREEMGFNGLVFTDALDMGALKNFGSPGRLAVLAIESGTDVLLANWGVSQEADAYDSVIEAVRSGKISEDQLDERVERVVEFKLKHVTGE